jgi:hypothetical protein
MASSKDRKRQSVRRRKSAARHGGRSPGAVRRLVSRPITWVAAALVTAATSVLVALFTAIPSQLVDERKLGDSVRGGDDIAVTVDQINDNGFYSMAFPGRWDLAPGDPMRAAIDADSALALVREERNSGAYPVPSLRIRRLTPGRVRRADLSSCGEAVRQRVPVSSKDG